MPNVTELREQAKAADITGYSSMNKAELEKALAEADAPAADAPEAPADFDPADIGKPTEPEKAGLGDIEEAGLEVRRGGTIKPASPKQGIPSDAERGGVTDKDLHAKNPKLAPKAFEPAEPAEPKPPPSITGARGKAGKPTEPDRGGLNDLERELSGAT